MHKQQLQKKPTLFDEEFKPKNLNKLSVEGGGRKEIKLPKPFDEDNEEGKEKTKPTEVVKEKKLDSNYSFLLLTA